ncbi:hypothetical protein JCM14720_11010 [Calditerricola yamamurae]
MVREPMVKRPTFALHGHHRLRSAHAAGDGHERPVVMELLQEHGYWYGASQAAPWK